MATDDVVWGYELEYYINIGAAESPQWVKVTELLTWEQAGEAKTYEPAWIDRKNPPTLTYGRSCTINMEKDTVRGAELEGWVMEHRNDLNVPCEIVKVYTWMAAGEGKVLADMAAFSFTPTPHSNASQGQPVMTAGALNMTGEDWAEGTWDATAKTFAPKAAPAPEPEQPPAQG